MKRTFEYKTNTVQIRFDITDSLTGRGYNSFGLHIFDGKETPIAARWGMGSFGFHVPGNYSDTLLRATYNAEWQTTITVQESRLDGIDVGDILKFELIYDEAVMKHKTAGTMKPKIIPCLIRGFFIGLVLGGIITITRQYNNPIFVFSILSLLAWIITFIVTVKMSIRYDVEKIVIPSLMVTYNWNNFVKIEHLKDSVKLTFNTPSKVLRSAKISPRIYFGTDEFKMFLEKYVTKEECEPNMIELFEKVQLPALIKNEKVPSVTDQNNRVLFKRNPDSFEMHKYVHDILEKHNLLDEIMEYFTNETSIKEILLSDDEGIKFTVGIGKR